MTIKTTAYLTGNKRDIHLTTPKALLIDIEGFRNHCWVLLDSVRHMMVKGHHKPIKVEIEAKIISYLKRGTEQAKTLQIKRIRRI